MKNVPKILLRTYLRRQPVHLRLSRFNFLTRYGWLKNLLEDLKPELFPQKVEDSPLEAEDLVPEHEDKTALEKSNQFRIKGKKGLYTAEYRLGKRGNGELFRGIESNTKQSIVIKEYSPRASDRFTTPEEENKIQQDFNSLAGFQYHDNRERDIRVIRPIEAIVVRERQDEPDGDGFSISSRFYLVTDSRDACPSLRKKLISNGGALQPHIVRTVLLQILQTLSVLHQQKITLPSGRVRSKLIHGNLSLDSVLWVEEKGHLFVYLSDFAQWETNIFDFRKRMSINAAFPHETEAQDLEAVGWIGYSLLKGDLRRECEYDREEAAHFLAQEAEDSPTKKDGLNASLNQNIRRLLQIEAPPFETAEAAWRSLLSIPATQTSVTQLAQPPVSQPTTHRSAIPRSALVALGVAALAFTGSLVWFLTPRASGQVEMSTPLPTCCLAEVSGLPLEDFSYTYLQKGTWESIRQKPYLGQQRQRLESTLVNAQDGLSILTKSAVSPEEAIADVQSGKVNFAILPLWTPDMIPPGLGAETIAYDGLVAVVSFSYAERQKGLPEALDGEISLAALRKIYLGSVNNWKALGGPQLPIKRYLSESPEVFPISMQQIHGTATLSEVEKLNTQSMLQQIITDFEAQQTGSIGLIPLSQIVGQCSVYPLAVSMVGQGAVQPWRLTSGDLITPKTDLCDRKGLYQADSRLFRSGEYPLAYPIVVVYPQDNSRSPAGEKFAELMKTIEGQQLLFDAGLVPLQEMTP